MTEGCLDTIINALADGKWWSIHELSTRSGLTIQQLICLLTFLKKYNLVELRQIGMPKKLILQARLDVSLQRFWHKIKEIENEEASTSSIHGVG